MDPFLYLALENTGSCRLVETGNFEDMGGIDPIIRASSHHTVRVYLEFIDRDLIGRC